MKNALALRKPVGTPVARDLTSASITTAAYVELASALTAPCSAIMVSNTSAKAIKLATGAAGSEVDQPLWIAPGAQSVVIPLELKKGVRLAAKALDADATTGFFVLNYLA